MADRPKVIPLYPSRSPAEEAASWAAVFHHIGDHAPRDWRRNPRARALVAAAEAFLGGESQRRGA